MEEEFNNLRVHFGSEGGADHLTFSQFVALPDARAEKLLNRESVRDDIAGRLAEMRAQARSSSVSSQGNSWCDWLID
jgi:hypothetical protein